MFAKLLPFSAGLPLAAAFAIGHSNTIPIQTSDLAGAASRKSLHANGQYPTDAHSAVQVPKRTMKSRHTDASLAARIRSSGTVTVGGQVWQPDPIPCASGLTIWRAIQGAGGPTEFGSMKRVNLFREGSRKVYDLTRPEMKDIILEANDTLEVPQKIPWGS